MDVVVPYGEGGVALCFPAGIEVVVAAPPATPPSGDAVDVVGRALDAPLSAEPLERAARGAARVAVVVSDETRPTATAAWIDAVLSRLARAGVSETTVVVARGIHAAPDSDALRRLVGARALGAARVVASDPDDPSANADLVADPRLGTVRVHRAVAEADLVVLTGSVAPHYLAGWSGGPKALVPGVADRASVEAAHRLTLDATVSPDGGVRSLSGRLEGNAFREALLRLVRGLRRAFCLNVVLGDDGGVAFAAAGDVDAAQRAAAGAFLRLRAVERPAPADLVVAGGGAPRDSDLLQAHKGLVAAAEVARPGAPILWFARAERGAGPPSFLPWFEAGRLPRHLGALRRAFQPYGLTAYALRWKAARHPVHVVSEVSPDVLRGMGLLPFPDGASALAHAMARARVERAVVLPRAAETCFAPPEPTLRRDERRPETPQAPPPR